MDSTRLAVELFDKRAKEYHDKFMDVSSYHNALDLFCKKIKRKNAKVLDVACGPGNLAKYLLQRRPDYSITGIDLSHNMLALARLNNPSAEFILMDGRAISSMDIKFDGIVCGFCLPYLSREEAVTFIHDASICLKPGGVLYISTMEDDYVKSGMETSRNGDRLFVYYHRADYLVKALMDSGFEILDLQRKSYIKDGGIELTDLLIVSKKMKSF